MSVKLNFFCLLLCSVLFIAVSCDDDVENPDPANDEEVITTLRLHFYENHSGSPIVFTFKDADGVGGNAPSVFDNITLKKNTTYTLKLELKNESNPADVEDISQEILEEDDEHQFFFTVNPSSLATVNYSDKDENDLPVGLANTVSTSATPGSGSFKVTLKHQPGLKSSSSTVATGETDIEVDFDLEIE